MTDSQIVAIAITVLAVMGGSLFNNLRISDLNGALTGKINDTKDVFRAELQAMRAEMKMGFAASEHKLDEILRIIGDHETRLTKLEQR